MNPYESDIPLESAEDWNAAVIVPLRSELKRLGIDVSDLNDDQLSTISERVIDGFDGAMPDVIDLGQIVDAVRFASKLAGEGTVQSEEPPGGLYEPSPASIVGGEGVESYIGDGRSQAPRRGENAPGVAPIKSDGRTAASPSTPRSADCPTCIPHKMNYPSGWWVVHSKFCPDHPMHRHNYIKIRPVGERVSLKETQRLKLVHSHEDYRSGVVASVNLSPYRDPDGRDISTPEMGE